MVCYLTTHLQSVEFVLGAGGPVVAGRAHGLFAHLTLVHVARRLVQVGERHQQAQTGQQRGVVQLSVRVQMPGLRKQADNPL